MLPWLLPLGLLIAVLLTAVANSVALGILFLLVGWVGVPLAYKAYARTRREEASTEEQ